MEHRLVSATTAALPSEWVRETRFGRWFLGTDIWRRYVLTEALNKLIVLADSRIGADAHILDLGCGEATAAPLLDALLRPRRITGVDIDAELISRGRVRTAIMPLSAPLELIEGCATQIPLEDGSVDIVLCHQLLHHMRAQPEALAEMSRVLRRDGVLLVAESCRCFIRSMPVRMLFRHPPESQRDATGYVELIRTAGFRLTDADIIVESPWWSLPDLGLRQRLFPSQRSRIRPEPSEVLAVAERPA